MDNIRKLQLKKASFIINLRKHTPTEVHVLLKKESEASGLVAEKEFNTLIKQAKSAVKNESELKRIGIEAVIHPDHRGFDFYNSGEFLSTWRLDNGLKKAKPTL